MRIWARLHTDALTCRQTHTTLTIDSSMREWVREKKKGRWRRYNYKALKHLGRIFMTWKPLARALSLPGGLAKNGGTGPCQLLPISLNWPPNSKSCVCCVLLGQDTPQRSPPTTKSQPESTFETTVVMLNNRYFIIQQLQNDFSRWQARRKYILISFL